LKRDLLTIIDIWIKIRIIDVFTWDKQKKQAIFHKLLVMVFVATSSKAFNYEKNTD